MVQARWLLQLALDHVPCKGYPIETPFGCNVVISYTKICTLTWFRWYMPIFFFMRISLVALTPKVELASKAPLILQKRFHDDFHFGIREMQSLLNRFLFWREINDFSKILTGRDCASWEHQIFGFSDAPIMNFWYIMHWVLYMIELYIYICRIQLYILSKSNSHVCWPHEQAKIVAYFQSSWLFGVPAIQSDMGWPLVSPPLQAHLCCKSDRPEFGALGMVAKAPLGANHKACSSQTQTVPHRRSVD